MRGTEECARCRIVFAKWEQRPRDRSPEQGLPWIDTSLIKDIPLSRMIWSSFLVAGFWTCNHLIHREPPGSTNESPSHVADGSQPSGVAPEQAGYDPSRGLSRIEGIRREIEGRLGSSGVTLKNLSYHFEKGAQVVHPAVLRYQGSELGLPEPEVQRFTEEDRVRAGGSTAKCLINGQWVYSEGMPATDDGVGECWSRRSGRRTEYGGTFTIQYMGGLGRAWERYVWQPNNRRWAPYGEGDEIGVMQRMIDTEYGFEAENRDREESRKQLEWAGDNRENRKLAIIRAYEARIRREGARYRLESMISGGRK